MSGKLEQIATVNVRVVVFLDNSVVVYFTEIDRVLKGEEKLNVKFILLTTSH